ncbi:hypothetical protein [Novosphingobium sp. PASSN1]|uniref:hypothetical protein n=1 Tax=Novosphingobium sp. PASSN1 TaxID=2015561 RepID=UPI000BD3E63F|nr:hypothetical protein [Novosphingobium sp. PASSN1]OYU33126.1 MAG: hypothetical protein CFE35_21910 [Novosphingobium sp. PASSN1]
MRAIAAALSVAALLATAGSAAKPARAGRAAHVTAASHCAGGERVVYSCQFGRRIGSVCLGGKALHYRFGPPGHPAIDVASDAAWSNIHRGGNRSQGGLNQATIRFTNGTTHYVVHAGETGSLNENPGKRISGLVVLQGASGEREVANLSCRAASGFNGQALDALDKAAPRGWDGAEAAGGPFDMVY